MKTTNMIGFSAVAVFAVLAAACGASQSTTSSAPIPGSTTTAPVVTPVQAIFVAGVTGSDSAEGTAGSPIRSINSAIALARAKGFADVYLYGGDEGLYAEIVDLADGVNVHGSICRATGSLAADAACPSKISGGSPTLVAEGIKNQQTVVENVVIEGAPAAQAGAPDAWLIPGAGCVGHGNAPMRFARCTPQVDEQGRAVAASALAVVVNDSTRVIFRSVTVRSSRGADGASGIGGADGEHGLDGTMGTPAGSSAWMSGAAGVGAANSLCPEAKGGNGGSGGRWYWDGQGTFDLTKFNFNNNVYSGLNGSNSYLGAAAGIGGAADVTKQRGVSGTNGANGTPSASNDGLPGTGGDTSIDPMTFTAREGADGQRGRAGQGGAGGAGGAPASIVYFDHTQSQSAAGGSVIPYYFGGSATSSFSQTARHNVGETAGGAGGGGASGGCGGYAGRGGQGGGASIAIFAAGNSNVQILASQLESGNGGNGGAGGTEGKGGPGGQGAMGTLGKQVAAQSVSGSFQVGGNAWIANVASFSATSSTDITKNNSESIGGAGGKGGDGAQGGKGGIGGGGAGGASILILTAGTATAVVTDDATVKTTGTPGTSAGNGAPGVALETKSL